VDEVLSQCAESTALRYKLENGVITVDADPMVVHANPVDLSIVFRNLIDNAVKYGGSPPEVLVTARWDEGQARVVIVDNGAGIPRHLRRKIFGRFVRLGDELERSRQGTGLGLYLVRTVVRSLGGAVRVRERRGASGTEFEVTIPDAQSRGRSTQQGGQSPEGRPPLELVAEPSEEDA
jgi:signal transduction histidine kinase